MTFDPPEDGVELRNTAEVIIRCPLLPPDLDRDSPVPHGSESLGIGRVVASVDRKWRPSVQPLRQVIPDQGKRLRLPPMSRRHEVPDLLPEENRQALLGGHLLGQFEECLKPGRDNPAVMERHRQPFPLQICAPEVGDDRLERRRRPLKMALDRGGQGMSKLDPRPFELEPMTAPVDNSRELHAAFDIGEGPARENGEPDARIGCQTPERFFDFRIEPRPGGTAGDWRQRPVEVEDQYEACPGLNL